jgi:hypothetical protein
MRVGARDPNYKSLSVVERLGDAFVRVLDQLIRVTRRLLVLAILVRQIKDTLWPHQTTPKHRQWRWYLLVSIVMTCVVTMLKLSLHLAVPF